MRQKLRLLISLVTLFLVTLFSFISCDLEDMFFKDSQENPFIKNVYNISNTKTTDALEFVVVADVHLDREQKDSGVTRYDDNFEEFLSEYTTQNGDFTALLSLGDLVDEQYPVNEDVNSFINRFAKYCSNLLITTVGNHDLHVANTTQWENSMPNTPGITYYAKRMCTIKCGEVSIYITNNAKRLFGSQQLKYLEEALKKEVQCKKQWKETAERLS